MQSNRKSETNAQSANDFQRFSPEELATMSDEEQLAVDLSIKLAGLKCGDIDLVYMNKTKTGSSWHTGRRFDLASSSTRSLAKRVLSHKDSFSLCVIDPNSTKKNPLVIAVPFLCIEIKVDFQNTCYKTKYDRHGRYTGTYETPDTSIPEQDNQFLSLLNSSIQDGLVLAPTEIFSSGNRFYLLYKYTTPIDICNLEQKSYHEALEMMIVKFFQTIVNEYSESYLSYKPTFKANPVGYIRLAGTYNTMTNEMVRLISVSKAYSFPEIASGFSFDEEQLYLAATEFCTRAVFRHKGYSFLSR